ncbi:hypothetical protein PTKIN_Ptkin04bG0207200 [Pterospermum kingtungense]
MGLIKTTMSLMAGAVFGIFLAQNYIIPSSETLSSTAAFAAKHYEETFRRPNKIEDVLD